MKSRSKSSRAETTGRNNRIKAETYLSFATPEYGEWKPDGNPTHYSSCHIRGYEVRLRFVMVWTAYCPGLDIETQFTHRTDEAKIIFLSDWLMAHIERPASSDAQLRQTRPAVMKLAQRHDIPVTLTDEIALERGF